MSESGYCRKDDELPRCIEEWGWRYHHMGIPTSRRMPDENYLPDLKMHVSGFSKSPFGIEWMRFEPGSPVDEMVQLLPHLAFEVDDLDYELKHRNLKIISEPSAPSKGVRVAMINYKGAPLELLEFSKA